MIRTALFYVGGAVAAVAMIAAGIMTTGSEATRAGALGGPVIIGGDDLTDHGGIDGSGNVVQGWLYIKNALASMQPNVGRGDGSIAALGSAADVETSFGAGAALTAASSELGISVTFYNGDTAINQFFADLGGSANPSIIWIAGNGAGNDLADGPGDEAAALTANATAIANFVASGGGLMSHGSEFGWLSALLPGVTAVCCGSSGDLYFTPEGSAALGSLTVGDINAGPWHNSFEGNFGGLNVLVRSNVIDDAGGQDAAVILGGAQVTFEEQPDSGEEENDTDCTPGLPGLPCGDESGGSGGAGDYDSNENDTVPPVTQPTPSVPDPGQPVPPAPTAPTGGAGAGGAGPITPPNTGTGSPGASTPWLAILGVTSLIAVTGAGLVTIGRRIR